jgi:hypothetical protein
MSKAFSAACAATAPSGWFLPLTAVAERKERFHLGARRITGRGCGELPTRSEAAENPCLRASARR